MNFTETTEGFRCCDGIYEVNYKIIDMFYFNYDPETDTFIYPDLEPNTLFKVRARLLRWHEDPNKMLRKDLISPVFGLEHLTLPKTALELLGWEVIWAIQAQAEPKMRGKYIIDENERRVVNPEWEFCEAPEVIRDDSVLTKFNRITTPIS